MSIFFSTSLKVIFSGLIGMRFMFLYSLFQLDKSSASLCKVPYGLGKDYFFLRSSGYETNTRIVLIKNISMIRSVGCVFPFGNLF